MKLWNDSHAFGAARRVKIDIGKLVDFVLIMLREPVVRARERLFFFQLHIRRSERKCGKALGYFRGACWRRVFEHRWISEGKRLVCSIHVSTLNLPDQKIVLHKRMDDQSKILKFESRPA